MAYDSKCLDLAQYFLGCEGDEGDELQASLAQAIQDTIEDWMAFDPDGPQTSLDGAAAGAVTKRRATAAKSLKRSALNTPGAQMTPTP